MDQYTINGSIYTKMDKYTQKWINKPKYGSINNKMDHYTLIWIYKPKFTPSFRIHIKSTNNMFHATQL